MGSTGEQGVLAVREQFPCQENHPTTRETTAEQQGFHLALVIFTAWVCVYWRVPCASSKVTTWTGERKINTKEKMVFNCKWITCINSRKQLLFPLDPLGIIFFLMHPRQLNSFTVYTAGKYCQISKPLNLGPLLHPCHVWRTITAFLSLLDSGEAQHIPRIPRGKSWQASHMKS